MNIRYVMLTTDSGNNEDYNIFYCPIYRVTGNGDFSEPVFKKTNYTTDVWVDTVEALGYEVEAVDLSYVVQEEDEEEDDGEEEESGCFSSGTPVPAFNMEEVVKSIFGGAEE